MVPPDKVSTIQEIIQGLEHLREKIDQNQALLESVFSDLAHQCDILLSEAKQQLHVSIMASADGGLEILPSVQIEDKRLKGTWIALYRHHNGATADEIGKEMGRHRTTVSTLLHLLEMLGWATKKRVGHEIVYQAVLKGDKEVRDK